PDHRPVVEADGSERPSEAVHDGEEVALQRTEDVLRLDAGTVPDRLDADAYVGCSVDGHHAVGAAARAAQQAAGPVVLEAAREDALARHVERRSDRVAGKRRHRPAAEREGQLL